MVSKNFAFQTVIRIIFLTVCIFLFLVFIFTVPLYPLSAFFFLLTVYSVYSLISYVQRTNRDLARFLEAVEYEDFSQTFSGEALGPAFAELTNGFNRVLRKFQKTRTEKEEHFRYLQTIVQHIGAGLVSYQKNGDVELINTAAKRLLKNPHLKNIRSLEAFSKELVDAMFTLRSGSKMLVEIRDDGEVLHYLLHAAEFVMHETKYMLVSIQNIQRELEEKELDAWHRLIRILTHEIMNSITPIASLASTSHDILSQFSGRRVPMQDGEKEMLDDLRGAVQTIEKRSRGLVHFVEAYRQLTRIPAPNFQIVSVPELFERVFLLMTKGMEEKAIHCRRVIEPPSLEITADPALIEQVLINLMMNSIQAMGERAGGAVEMRASIDKRGRILLQIADNGCGLLDEVQSKIFIPFFTTKPNGSGIGLSLSQQIMRLHRGSISVQSKPNERTVFTLRF